MRVSDRIQIARGFCLGDKDRTYRGTIVRALDEAWYEIQWDDEQSVDPAPWPEHELELVS